MRTQGEDGRLQAKDRGLELILLHTLGRTQPCSHLELRLLASGPVRGKCLLLKPPQSVGLCDSGPSTLTQGFQKCCVNSNSSEANKL